MNNDNIEFGPGSFSGNSSLAPAGSGIIKIPADQYFSISNGDPTTLSSAAVKDTYTINVTDPSTFSIGDAVVITTAIASYTGKVLAVVGSQITLDGLLNYAYPGGTPIQSRSRDLNVDGSVTPQKFEIFLPAGILPQQINVVRFIAECLTTAAVDLSTFGDIAGGLTKGLLLRGSPDPASGIPETNQWNVKTNGELAVLAYDWTPYAASNPVQGQNGFLWRYTYGGEDKHNITPPINSGDKLEMIVQDDLTTILKFQILYGGNFQLN